MDPHEKFKRLTFGVPPTNDGDIVVHVDKAHRWPSWAAEADVMPKMRWTNNGQMEVTRTYVIPWGKIWDFRDYALGHCNAFTDLAGPARFVFTREIPMQDPCEPHLYAQEMSLVQTGGKAVRRRMLTVAQRAALKKQQDLDNLPAPVPDLGGFNLLDKRKKVPLKDGAKIIVKTDAADERKVLGYDTTWFATEAPSVEGAPELSPGVMEGSATVEVVFRPVPYIVRSDDEIEDAQKRASEGRPNHSVPRELCRWVSWSLTYQYTTLPLHKLTGKAGSIQLPLKFIEGPATIKFAVVDEPGILIVPTDILMLTWHSVPFVPWDTIRRCEGRVNSRPFGGMPGFELLAAETMLCQSPVVEEKGRTVRGQKLWDIKYQFHIRRETWQSFPAWDMRFYRAAFVGAGNLVNSFVYGVEDFNDLFVLTSAPVYQ